MSVTRSGEQVSSQIRKMGAIMGLQDEKNRVINKKDSVIWDFL